MYEKLETFFNNLYKCTKSWRHFLITYINVRKVGDIFNNLYEKLETFLITYNVRKVGDIFNNLYHF